MKKYFVAALLLSFSFVNAQITWPAITKTTKPWTRWWWEGSAVNKADLTSAMNLYEKAGLGGLEITPIYGVKGHEAEFIPFLSGKWMDMLQYTLSEAKRLNMGIDVANATGWPFGGPWVTPTDACKNINLKTYTLKEGETLQDKITFQQEIFYRSESKMKVDVNTLSYPIATNKNLQAYAFDQVRYPKVLPITTLMAYSDKGEKIELTNKVDAAGKLNWTALQGNWTLYALFQGWHGKMVERAAPGGEGDVIDHYSATALKHYLNRFDEAFKGKDISGIRSFFNDSYEVDDAKGQSNWTPNFFNEFLKRRGYDLKNELPALYQKDKAEKNVAVLYDYRQTVSELILENFTIPWQHWAATKGKMVRNQSHGSPSNILDCYAVVDIPETEGADILRFKFATSTANVMGKPLASSETATWLNEHFQSSLGDVKQAVDKYFVGGVNHVFWHGTNYSPQNEAWPGWLFYAAVHFTPANSFWKDFGTLNNYVARCQSFLQKGKPNNDVLVYFPINDRFSEPGNAMLQHFDGMEGFERSTFKTSSDYLLEHGYAFDFISDKQISEQVKSSNSLLQTGGNNYQTILLANVKYLPLATMNKLVDLAKNGATILLYKNLPKDVPGYGGLQEKQTAYNKLLDMLVFKTVDNSNKKATVGKGSFILGDDLQSLLNYAKIRREDMGEKGLQYNRRQYANGHYYFISNKENKAFDGWVTLESKEANVVLFDPMLLKNGIAQTRKNSEGKTEVYLQLNIGESVILQTANTVVAGNKYPYINSLGNKENIAGTWQIKFVTGGPTLPASVTTTTLGSWTDLDGEEVKKFSGTALYSTQFSKPKANATSYLLDLGKVEESAEVFLNGKRLATLLGPIYQISIPANQLKESNLLEMKVTNGMVNRIIDLDKRGVEWKKFYNTNFPARRAENRDANNIFTAVKWTPKPAGLFGPVTIAPIKFVF